MQQTDSAQRKRLPPPTVAAAHRGRHQFYMKPERHFYNLAMHGRLFLFGTPLGNLGDFSPRALETMRALDVLFCEDTRQTAKLTAHFGITVGLRPLHDDSPLQHWEEAVRQVLAGRRVGYASDAGMPGVSDPGRRLLRAAWSAGVIPTVIPGPSAVTTLASYCPFIGAAFQFAGFVPRKAGERAAFALALRDSPIPCVVFEAPSRVHSFMDELCSLLEPERELVAGRELTKIYEQVLLFQAGSWLQSKPLLPALGEFTIAVAGAPEVAKDPDELQFQAALARLEAAGFSRKDALRALAAVWEVPANKLKALSYRRPEGS